MWYFLFIMVKKNSVICLFEVFNCEIVFFNQKNTTIAREIPHLYSRERLVVVLREIRRQYGDSATGDLAVPSMR